ncbi:MAG TPA: hypothetical protein VHJ20_03220 [Polyangia bacterium]|nr:hypothetical protein [Polyangia bacterium]
MRRSSFEALSKGPLGTASIAAALVVSLVFAIAGASHARAATRERRFFSARHGVGVDAPTGWTLSQHTGFPSILVLLLHPNGARISVSAAATTAADSRALADQNRRALEAQHVVVGKEAPGARGGVAIEARNPAHNEELRQLYLVRALPNGTRQAVVVTLVAKTDALAAAAPGYGWAVEHLALETPTGTDEAPDASAARERDSGSAARDAADGGRR